MDAAEKREFSRVNLRATASLDLPDGTTAVGDVLDLSMKGIAVRSALQPELDTEGQVWTFGCNDEGSLGRVVAEEEDCFVPGKVEIEEKVVGISAGDSHSAALTETGNGWHVSQT